MTSSTFNIQCPICHTNNFNYYHFVSLNFSFLYSQTCLKPSNKPSCNSARLLSLNCLYVEKSKKSVTITSVQICWKRHYLDRWAIQSSKFWNHYVERGTCERFLSEERASHSAFLFTPVLRSNVIPR